MTEQQTTETEPEGTEPDPATETEGAEPDPATETESSPNAEAAKYRTRAKEAETERDSLRGQVEAMQRREVERLATDHVLVPSGIWAAGAELPSLLADDGTVDADKVRVATLDAATRLGLAPTRNGGQSAGEGRNGRPSKPGKSFEDAFKIN